MEKLLIILIILLIILIFLFSGIVIYLLFKGLKNKDTKLTSTELIEEVKNKYKDIDSVGKKCVDHPELDAKGICSISDAPYCELCITKEKDVKFARKYLSLFLDSQWQTIRFALNDEFGADLLNELYKVKKELWKNHQIPLITQKQYKINVESDKIETYTCVMARTQDVDAVKAKINFL